jgi:hypothetical protein
MLLHAITFKNCHGVTKQKKAMVQSLTSHLIACLTPQVAARAHMSSVVKLLMRTPIIALTLLALLIATKRRVAAVHKFKVPS